MDSRTSSSTMGAHLLLLSLRQTGVLKMKLLSSAGETMRLFQVMFVMHCICCDNDVSLECLYRVNKLKRQFKHFYVIVVLPTGEQNESFNQSYFKYAK